MKNLIFAFLIMICAVIAGCESDTAETNPLKIAGTWELKTAINGMTGAPTDYPPGNGKQLKFTATNYEVYDSGKLVKSGTYQIISETMLITHSKGNRIIYDDEKDSIRNFFDLKDNTLMLSIDAYDAPSTVYIKLAD